MLRSQFGLVQVVRAAADTYSIAEVPGVITLEERAARRDALMHGVVESRHPLAPPIRTAEVFTAAVAPVLQMGAALGDGGAALASGVRGLKGALALAAEKLAAVAEAAATAAGEQARRRTAADTAKGKRRWHNNFRRLRANVLAAHKAVVDLMRPVAPDPALAKYRAHLQTMRMRPFHTTRAVAARAAERTRTHLGAAADAVAGAVMGVAGAWDAHRPSTGAVTRSLPSYRRHAATAIQRQWRVYYARQELLVRAAEARKAARAAAATVLAAAFRACAARRAWAATKRQHINSVIAIQIVARRWLWQRWELKNASSRVIVGLFRRARRRRGVRLLCALSSVLARRAAVDAAAAAAANAVAMEAGALAFQRVVRGHLGRVYARLYRARATAAANIIGEWWHGGVTAARDARWRADTIRRGVPRLQSAWRGYLERRARAAREVKLWRCLLLVQAWWRGERGRARARALRRTYDAVWAWLDPVADRPALECLQPRTRYRLPARPARYAALNALAAAAPLEAAGHSWEELVAPGHVSMHFEGVGFARESASLMQFLYDCAAYGGPVPRARTPAQFGPHPETVLPDYVRALTMADMKLTRQQRARGFRARDAADIVAVARARVQRALAAELHRQAGVAGAADGAGRAAGDEGALTPVHAPSPRARPPRAAGAFWGTDGAAALGGVEVPPAQARRDPSRRRSPRHSGAAARGRGAGRKLSLYNFVGDDLDAYLGDLARDGSVAVLPPPSASAAAAAGAEAHPTLSSSDATGAAAPVAHGAAETPGAHAGADDASVAAPTPVTEPATAAAGPVPLSQPADAAAASRARRARIASAPIRRAQAVPLTSTARTWSSRSVSAAAVGSGLAAGRQQRRSLGSMLSRANAPAAAAAATAHAAGVAAAAPTPTCRVLKGFKFVVPDAANEATLYVPSPRRLRRPLLRELVHDVPC